LVVEKRANILLKFLFEFEKKKVVINPGGLEGLNSQGVVFATTPVQRSDQAAPCVTNAPKKRPSKEVFTEKVEEDKGKKAKTGKADEDEASNTGDEPEDEASNTGDESELSKKDVEVIYINCFFLLFFFLQGC
jgi:hypothetical protein